MGFRETVEVQIDIAANKGAKALQQLKSDVAAADGSFAKMGATVKGAGNVLSAMPLSAVAGAAVGAGLAIKGLADNFTETALNANKMASATGLTVTAASEWIAAGDDVGVTADTMAGAFGKATKAIGLAPEKFDALGVSLAHTKDGAVDMNGTLINAIDAINGIQDPTQKAALASQLFGKSWAELTPLIDRGGAAIRETMEATSDAQRITEEEVESAKKWQAVMDNLGDVVTDLKLDLGELIVQALGPSLEAVAALAAKAMELENNLKSLGGLKLPGIEGLPGPIEAAAKGTGLWIENLSPLALSLKTVDLASQGLNATVNASGDAYTDWTGIVHTAADAGGSWGDEMATSSELVAQYGRSMGEATSRVEHGTDAAKTYADFQKKQTDAINDTTKAIDALNQMRDQAIEVLEREQNAMLSVIDSEVGYKRAVDDVGTALGEFQQSQVAAATTVDDAKTSTDEAAEAQLAMEGSSRSLEDAISKAAAQAVIYAQDQAEAAGQTFTTSDKIAAQAGALLELKGRFPELAGPIDAHIAKLNAIPGAKKTIIEIDTGESTADLQRVIDQMAQIHDKTVHVNAIGTVNVHGTEGALGGFKEGLVLVGEEGPEIVALPGGSYIFTAEETRRLKAGGMAGGGMVGGDLDSLTPAQLADLAVKRAQDDLAAARQEKMRAEQLAAQRAKELAASGWTIRPDGTMVPPPYTGSLYGPYAAVTPAPVFDPFAGAGPTGVLPFGYFQDASGVHAPTGGPEFPSALSQMRPPAVPPRTNTGGVGAGQTGTIINVYTGANPQEVVEAIRKYERMNGAGWRN
jgi:hypothetical protein